MGIGLNKWGVGGMGHSVAGRKVAQTLEGGRYWQQWHMPNSELLPGLDAPA